MYTKNNIIKTVNESINVKRTIIGQSDSIIKIINKISKCIKKGGKIFICGNGGSAADAQHIAAEFLIRLRPKLNRKPYPVISLALDSSTLTACGNDYGFKYIFSRGLDALGSKDDILITITTSGNSQNISEVCKVAKRKKIKIIGFLGNKGGKILKYTENAIIVKSTNTARIQETHIMLGHLIFEQVENILIKRK